jgi:hypothetical protein
VRTVASSSNRSAGPPTGQEPDAVRRPGSTGGRAAGAARRVNRLAGGVTSRLRGAAGRARGVATSARARRLLPAAGAASALGVVASLAGRSGRRRGGGLAAALDGLLAGPAAAYRRRRRRQRVRAAGRLLAGLATAPLHAAGSLGAGRGRPGPAAPRPLARKRRSKKMAGNFKLAVGLAAGYVLGTRAGRERYERMVETAREVADRPEVQRLADRLRGSLGAGLDKATSGAGDRLQRARAGAEGPDRDRELDRNREPDRDRELDRGPAEPGEQLRSRAPDRAPDAGDEEGEQRPERSRAARTTRR